MEKPSLEEVKEYFKNVDSVECNNDYDKYYLDLKQQFEILSDSIRILNQADDSFGGMNSYCQLWTDKKGYAKILTYKNTEPKFEITKEQILELENGFTLPKLKEWFPEAFETILEDNKWYKHKANPLVFKTGKSNGYGFNDKFVFETGINNWSFDSHPNNWKEATAEEVKKALENEAVKRGIKEGVFIIRTFDENLNNCSINIYAYPNDAKWFYHSEDDYLEHYGFVVYSKGQWAKVIETKTKEEAEELLKDLGHNFKIV